MGSTDRKDPSDEELVRRAQAFPHREDGRQAAAELLRRYQGRVEALCYYYLANHDQARDMAQDVLLRAYENLGSIRGSNRFASWIYAIARNRCRSELRRVRPRLDEGIDPDELSGSGIDPVESMVQRLDEETLLALIRERLTEEEQTVLWLRCIEKMPLASVNMLMDLPQASGARAVLQRARRKLRAARGSRPSADEGTGS